LTICPGGQTTSSAIAALFYYLARYPGCYKLIASEIRSTFTHDDQITHSKLSSCTYLRACIDETLRVSPPAPGTLWREVPENSRQHVVVDGHVIPDGTAVGVNIYAIHHNEQYFPDAATFRPERWITSETPDISGTMRGLQQIAFTPFSIGTRGCMGKGLAYMEIGLIAAKTLWNFDFEEHPDYRPREQERSVTQTWKFVIRDQLIATHDGPYLVFQPIIRS
jgi:cytochrome P450